MTLWTPVLIILTVAVLILIIGIFSRALAIEMAWAVVGIAVLGILSHIIGESLPRRWFDPERFPWREYRWERSGKYYEKWKIRRWKEKMPDKSRWTDTGYSKTMHSRGNEEDVRRLLQETCVAECIHWGLLFASPLVLLFVQGWGALFVVAVYALSNFPFIMIQRYNRPRLRLLLRRSQRKECAVV